MRLRRRVQLRALAQLSPRRGVKGHEEERPVRFGRPDRSFRLLLWFVVLTLPACFASPPPGAPAPLLPSPSATSTLAAPTKLIPTPSHSPAPPLPSPSALPTPSPTPDPLPSLTLDQKIGLLLLAGINGATLTPWTRSLLTKYHVGGIVLRGRNVQDAEQVKSLISNLQSLGQAPLFIAIDQEGGDVTRITDGLTHFPSAMALGATGDPDLAYRVGYATAGELLSVGVNVNLAPVLDTLTNPENAVIGARAFGSDPALVKLFGVEFMRGTLDAGALPVVKHYPGHGGTDVDSHSGLPTVDKLDTQPFDFAIANGAPVVMVGHLWVKELDADSLPASLSPQVIGRLRRNFGGVILTDSLNMGAITNQHTPAEAALLSFQAGADWLLVAELGDVPAVFSALRQAVKSGAIPMERLDASARRLLALRARPGAGPHPTPNLAANQSLAQAVARQALALTCRDQAAPCSAQIPPGVKKILLLAPNHLPPAEPGAGQITYLAQLLAAHGYRVVELLYRLDAPNPDYPRQAELYAKANDVILFGAWDAHLHAALQTETLRRVQRAKKPVVVLGLHTPFDLEHLPEADVYLATFGETRVQMEAVVEALVGEVELERRRPIFTNP